MRVVSALVATFLVACSSAEPEEPTDGEAAVVAADSFEVVDRVETQGAVSTAWSLGPDGRAWVANGTAFGLIGKTPGYTAEGALNITASYVDASAATLLLGVLHPKIVKVDLATAKASTLLPAFDSPATLHRGAMAVDATGAYFVGTSNSDDATGDLWRVTAGGPPTLVARDLWAPRPGSTCDLFLMLDASSVFAIQACDAGSEIVQVPKAGGSPHVIAGHAGIIRSAALTSDAIVYTSDSELVRIPKTGGARTLTRSSMFDTVAADGTDILYVDASGREKVTLWRQPSAGGAPQPLVTLSAVTAGMTLRARAILPAKDAIYVAVAEGSSRTERWVHQLIKVRR